MLLPEGGNHGPDLEFARQRLHHHKRHRGELENGKKIFLTRQISILMIGILEIASTNLDALYWGLNRIKYYAEPKFTQCL